MFRKISLSLIVLSFLTACAHIPGGVSASNIPLAPNSYTILEEVEGNDCYYSLLGLIPLTDGNESKDALEDALIQVPETDALIQITADSYFQYWILWSNTCTQVRGTAVRNNI
ncbi:MAG: hypothetical protein PSN04_04345 [Methyloprofundus sp.]|nr:hypothetical protein [Methyloprofundus sp.]